MIRNKPKGAVTCGIDIGKNLFHVVGVDADGKPIFRLCIASATRWYATGPG